jgi:hypothetical protein
MSVTREEFDFSGLGIVLEGSAAREEIEELSRDWEAYHAVAPVAPFLSLRVLEDRPAEEPGPAAPKGMTLRFDGTAATYGTSLGTCRVEPGGRATVHLAPGEKAARRLALQNLVRAAIAFLLPSRGGAAVHAAGIVLDGRGFLLPGASGAGKSTAASLAESRGALVVSDDLVLVDGADKGAVLLGAPFRSTHPVACPPGRWPLAGILIPEKGTAPSLRPAPPLMVRALLLSNLTFVAELVADEPRVAAVVEKLATEVRSAVLTFAREPSFVDLLRKFDR